MMGTLMDGKVARLVAEDPRRPPRDSRTRSEGRVECVWEKRRGLPRSESLRPYRTFPSFLLPRTSENSVKRKFNFREHPFHAGYTRTGPRQSERPGLLRGSECLVRFTREVPIPPLLRATRGHIQR